MQIDLERVPFSRRGAYLSFSFLPEAGDLPAGLYLRSVHGGAQDARPGGRVARVEVLAGGRPVPFEARATPAALDLVAGQGTLSICIAEPSVVRVRGEGVGLRLTFAGGGGDYAIPAAEGRWRINSPAHLLQFMLTPLAGEWQVNAPWDGLGAEVAAADLVAGAGQALCEGALEEFLSSWRPRGYEQAFADCRAAVEADFERWLAQTPDLPEAYAEARRLAAYINWSSLVDPAGLIARPTMYMSKNWMTNVWSWDHCFNAMALAYHDPALAWDQFMTLFDRQDETGALPDFYNDRSELWNFCKPPIHGWALDWMMRRAPFIGDEQVRQVYGPLARWTEWWFAYRDDDRDGLPQYHHGNDSGWDNATPFLVGVPLEAPDLSAYLVLQMETLARLAARLGDPGAAESWRRRSAELVEKTLAHFWRGDHFTAARSGDHQAGDYESLFLYLPLILGKRLPEGARAALIAGLTRHGRFLTAHGLATESPASPYYDADGYWRGPIWGPSTMVMVEALAACGELALARDLARKYCDLCAASGFAENFDALSGAGLRDRAYTWTASVFLVLGHEYLLE